MKDKPINLSNESDPWMRFAGAWKDDPDWDIFEEGVRLFREEMNRNACDSVPNTDRNFDETLRCRS